jgi:putative nucleotidyltransferase with HDIG domain
MPTIEEYLKKATTLPPAPRILPQLLTVLNQPNIDSGKLVDLILLDPALTVAVIRQCNSAFLGASMPVSDLREAVTRLGFQKVYQIVAAISGSKALQQSQRGYGMELGQLWQHSVTTAIAAQILARYAGENENLIFTAGLLHDLGKIVLSEVLAVRYQKLIQTVKTNKCSVIEAEKELLGVNHAEVGGTLLQQWRFSNDLVAAVRFHHDPFDARPYERLAALVHLGDLLAYCIGQGYGYQAFAVRGRREAFDLLRLSPEDFPGWMLLIHERLDVIEALFQAAG